MNRQLNTISISCNLLYEAMAYKKFAKAMAMSVLIKNKVTSSTVVGYTKKELYNITDCDFRTVKKHLKILREYGMVREEKIKKKERHHLPVSERQKNRKEHQHGKFGHQHAGRCREPCVHALLQNDNRKKEVGEKTAFLKS